MRAAIYARSSTALQREASIEDQERLCRERAEREGWQVIASFADRAVSGASMIRPGLQLEDVRLELDGALTAMLDLAQPGATQGVDVCSVKVVAGARYQRQLLSECHA